MLIRTWGKIFRNARWRADAMWTSVFPTVLVRAHLQ